MALPNSTKITWCCPFCFLGDVEPAKLSRFVLIWDWFLLLSWYAYNIVMDELITIYPLIINSAMIFLLVIVGFELTNARSTYPNLRHSYIYFKIAISIIMTIFAFSCFLLIFVFAANPTLQGTILNFNTTIAYFTFFTPLSVIEWGTIFSLKKSLANYGSCLCE